MRPSSSIARDCIYAPFPVTISSCVTDLLLPQVEKTTVQKVATTPPVVLNSRDPPKSGSTYSCSCSCIPRCAGSSHLSKHGVCLDPHDVCLLTARYAAWPAAHTHMTGTSRQARAT